MAANCRRSSSSVRSPSPKRVSRRDFIGWTGALAGGAVQPISGVTIGNCEFGAPVASVTPPGRSMRST
nr:hypothetical protein [Burkholderia sp. BCC1977]